MFRIYAPILVIPTTEVQRAVGFHLKAAGLAAYREITQKGKGLEIAHLQFAFGQLTLAVCSRVRRDGAVEIELGLGDPRLPEKCFTLTQMRQAEASARARTSSRGRGKIRQTSSA